MSDWKSALRDLKKELLTAKGPGDHAKRALTHRPSSHVSKPENKQSFSRLPVAISTPKDTKRLARPPIHLKRPAEPKAVTSRRQIFAEAQRPQVQTPAVPLAPMKPRGVPDTFQAQLSTSLTRQANFKLPDAWVSEGSRTQLPTKRQPGSAIDVFIGLDFGTSYTKAAVGLKDQIFVVDWFGVSAGADRYLLPSEFSIFADGSCQIGQAADVPFDQVCQRLKHPLIDAAVSTGSLANASVFLALVLRYIRAWVFFHHSEKIGVSSIRWMLNIGAPSNGLESERHRHAYLKTCSSAWSMSLSESAAMATHAVDLIEMWHPDNLPQDLIDLDVLPEFVAQIAGYVQSAQRQYGLHALVDVGGGTLDVVTFIIHKREGEDVFPFLVPEIRALGTQMLYLNRLVEAPGYEEAKLPDDLQPVLSAFEYAKATGLPVDHITLRDKVFWGEVHSAVHRVLDRTKRNRYRFSDAWIQGLPIFLTGGGGSVEGYIKSVKSGSQHCAPKMTLISLPQHPKLAGYTGTIGDYQRVSVACGLAQDAFSLGQLIPAGQVEDDVSVVPHASDRPDRDELYAR